MSKLKVVIIILTVVGLGFGVYQLGLNFKGIKKETGKRIGTFISEGEKFSTPSVYHIENVLYYGEKNWCWGSSALMLLMDAGLTEEEIQNARAVIKNEGRGGPPDMFIGFQEYGLADNVRIAYSKDSVEKYADFYNSQLLVNPEEQTILFDNQKEAFNYLKSLISSDVLVMIVVHNGNHFVIATGYDGNYIYTNDPGWDNGYDYKIDSAPDLKQRRIPMENFLEEWSISGQEEEIGGKIGFPGNYGMIWLAE
ncbi:hypothetical protein ISS86_01970 [Candidatus Microgenomates bacterium]|nr:hypothetical protein [Candidatus Microgenomates bacterium]